MSKYTYPNTYVDEDTHTHTNMYRVRSTRIATNKYRRWQNIHNGEPLCKLNANRMYDESFFHKRINELYSGFRPVICAVHTLQMNISHIFTILIYFDTTHGVHRTDWLAIHI